MLMRREEWNERGAEALYDMSASEIASGGHELFPRLPSEYRSRIHVLIDEAWDVSVKEGRSADFAREVFPQRIAEELRATIIEASAKLGEQLGAIVKRAAGLGFWLDGPTYNGRGKHRFHIWRIDQSHELLGCRPAAVKPTLREVDAWLAKMPRHEFHGDNGSAHYRLRYLRAREHWLKAGRGNWTWPPAAVRQIRQKKVRVAEAFGSPGS
jgi:hypothetical protein